MSYKRLMESAAVRGWEIALALIFHNLTIMLSAWLGFVMGRRTMEMDELEEEQHKRDSWDKGGS